MSSWILACILFVFGSLFGYAIILIILYQRIGFVQPVKGNNTSSEDMFGFAKGSLDVKKNKTKKLDTIFIVLMPLLFFIFNGYYWSFLYMP